MSGNLKWSGMDKTEFVSLFINKFTWIIIINNDKIKIKKYDLKRNSELMNKFYLWNYFKIIFRTKIELCICIFKIDLLIDKSNKHTA